MDPPFRLWFGARRRMSYRSNRPEGGPPTGVPLWERRPRRDSAPDVVSTQSARGRASYRCPIVGAAPPPRFGACGAAPPPRFGACGHATAMAVRLSGAAKPCIGRVHALNAWAIIASRPGRGCNAPRPCCKESVTPIILPCMLHDPSHLPWGLLHDLIDPAP